MADRGNIPGNYYPRALGMSTRATSDRATSGLPSKHPIWTDPAMADDYFETGLAVALFLYLAAMIIIQSLL